MKFSSYAFTILLLFTIGCAQTLPNYGPYREQMPRSILVLPPLNDSIEVDAPYIYLSTITEPLAELGYYVFPVAVVDNFMKDNGLPTPFEMHNVSLSKLKQVFGADAVLYLRIEDWGQKYQVVNSATVVKVNARLVNLDTGDTLWQSAIQAYRSSGNSGNSLLGQIVSAAVTQAINSSFDQTRPLAITANRKGLLDRSRGLLLGPRHPEFDTDPRGR